MRSVRVVFPESMCALIPMFRSLDNSLITTAPWTARPLTGRTASSKIGAPYNCCEHPAPGETAPTTPHTLFLLNSGKPDCVVPLVPVPIVCDAVPLLANDARDRRGVHLAVPLDPNLVIHLVLVGLRRLHGLGADL